MNAYLVYIHVNGIEPPYRSKDPTYEVVVLFTSLGKNRYCKRNALHAWTISQPVKCT